MSNRPAVEDCPHGPDNCTAEVEGWENPAEPMSIRIECNLCWGHIDVRVEDPSLLKWEEGP